MIEYMVVHEMVHLIEPNYTRAFWDRVDRILPDFEERKRSSGYLVQLAIEYCGRLARKPVNDRSVKSNGLRTGAAGFEPATRSLEGCYSIRLSYAPNSPCAYIIKIIDVLA